MYWANAAAVVVPATPTRIAPGTPATSSSYSAPRAAKSTRAVAAAPAAKNCKPTTKPVNPWPKPRKAFPVYEQHTNAQQQFLATRSGSPDDAGADGRCDRHRLSGTGFAKYAPRSTAASFHRVYFHRWHVPSGGTRAGQSPLKSLPCRKTAP